MLKPINCPSYIKTQVTNSKTGTAIDVAEIPYDQFHTLMTDVLAQNRKMIEVNTILSDLVTAGRNADTLSLQKIVKRAAAYLGDQ